jgi:tRNA(fMet)-specific endonuclease VapC
VIVADTDVLIDYLEGIEPAAKRIHLELEREELVTTVISRFELLAGAGNARQERILKELLVVLKCLPLDEPSADRAAGVRRSLEARGVGIGMGDSLIAGIVLRNDGVLLTRNRRHFERVPDLSLGRI